MAQKKMFSKAVDYEQKLFRVMQRLGVNDYRYDWTRSDCFIEFRLDGNSYRFYHSLDKAKELGIQTQYVSDLFAILVLSLEDLARMSERGAYKLSTWLEGMKLLPPPKSIPACFQALGFTDIPDTIETVKKRYHDLSKIYHPENGGEADAFVSLRKNYTECINYFSPHPET